MQRHNKMRTHKIVQFALVIAVGLTSIKVAYASNLDFQTFGKTYTEEDYSPKLPHPASRYFKSVVVEIQRKGIWLPLQPADIVGGMTFRINDIEYTVPTRCFKDQRWPLPWLGIGAHEGLFYIVFERDVINDTAPDNTRTMIEIKGAPPFDESRINCIDF